MSCTFIIKGITTHQKTFRPTDWADRLAGRLCTIHMRRLRYSPYLYPTVYEAHRGLYVDGILAKTHPMLYADLQSFAATNDLEIVFLSDHS